MNQTGNVKKVFLLGGHDLEMMTVKRILEDNNHHVEDKKLNWSNARLSEYKEELERYSSDRYCIYGIELQEDGFDILPENYVRIDHHNHLQSRPSALEQVAEIIGHRLNEDELLIAANDSGYYPEMKEFLSEVHQDWTPEQIRTRMDEIRKEDRRCQGVEDWEEDAALKTVGFKYGEYTLVITNLEHFSPICDALWPYERLLICRPVEGKASLCYYGNGAQDTLAEFRRNNIDIDTYSGGGPDGYWGIIDKDISLERLYDIVRYYVPTLDKADFSRYVESAHMFYFPFKWDWENDMGGAAPDAFRKLNEIKSVKWHKGKTADNKERESLFNELNYFFPFVHRELYEYTEELGQMQASILSEEERKDWMENPRILHFERVEKDLVYEIVVKVGKDTWRKYSLNIDAVNLNLYSTGVGLLSVYAKNRTGLCLVTSDKDDWTSARKKMIDRDDVLKINQFGRRVMPPFYGDVDTRSEIAESIRISGTGLDLYDDFGDFMKTDNGIIKPSSWKCSKVIDGLLDDFRSDIRYEIVIDDRMFVMTWYKNDTCLSWAKNDLHKCMSGSQTDECSMNGGNYWYKFLFVDNESATCQNENMRQDLLRQHSYVRWTDWGSLYGVTRYSFVYLTDAGVPPYLLEYFESMYARMVELVLMQRATVLKFSERINMINNIMGGKESERKLTQSAINKLCHDYIVFKNKFYFKEVTAQDQGIEMYDMLQKSLRLEEMVKDLDEDIQELYQYQSILEEQAGNRKAQTLNNIMSFFTPASCVAALVALGGWRDTWTKAVDPWYICGVGVAFALVLSIAIWGWIRYKNRDV